MRPIMFPRANVRRILLLAGVLFFFLASICCFLLLTMDSGPNLHRDNIRKIKAGMSETEVEAIVGVRPTFHSEEPDADVQTSGWAIRQVTWTKADGWVSEGAQLTVMDDEDGKVVGTRYYSSCQQ